jgi:MraZ protein
MKSGFRKSFHRSLDSKGRLMLPPEYRDIIHAASDSGGFTLIIYDECIVACPTPEWEAFTEKIEQLRNLRQDTRRFRSQLMGRAEELELDPQGRARISQALMRYAGLSKDVVLVGLGSRFEIWDRQRFEGIKLDDAALDIVVKELAQSGIDFSL